MAADIPTTIQHLHREGKSQREIARTTGLSRYQVRAILDTPQPKTRAPAPGVSLKGLAGRVSSDRPLATGFGGVATNRSLSATSGDVIGTNTLLLDTDSLARLPVSKLIDITIDASPEVSRALWDFLRMAVPGYEINVYKPGTEEPDIHGQEVLDTFRDTLRWRHGDESVIYRSMFISAWMRGAIILELEMDDAGIYPVDIVTPDPALFRFMLTDNHWILGQYHGGEWVPMDRPTFRHVQIDPKPGRPEGRAPASSSMFPAIFLLGIYQDLRRVIANQGYPRLDVVVKVEALATLIRDKVENVPELNDLLNDVLGDITYNVGRVGPGDAYAHADFIEMKAPIGTLGGDLSGAIGIIDGLERMLTRALKTDTLSMALRDTADRSNANRQWEQRIQSIKSIQQPAENLLESIYEMALQAFGIIADVEFRFATIRATEELRDAQTETIVLNNAAFKQDRGWLTPNEAALQATGTVSAAVNLTYDDPNGSAALGEVAAVTTNNPADPAALGLDGERMIRMLPPAPSTVTISRMDEQDASDAFDLLEPDYAGLLEASVE